MDLFACGELLDEWMTGSELKGKQGMLSYTQII
jgi:hypothetical protein